MLRRQQTSPPPGDHHVLERLAGVQQAGHARDFEGLLGELGRVAGHLGQRRPHLLRGCSEAQPGVRDRYRWPSARSQPEIQVGTSGTF